MNRVCNQCGSDLPIERFYFRSDRQIFRRECVDCFLKAVRRRRKTREYRKSHRDSNKKYLARNSHKYIAHNALNNAVRDGKIVKLPCEQCGNPKSQGHHDDYSKPLDVRWLCDAHHKEAHKKLKEMNANGNHS